MEGTIYGNRLPRGYGNGKKVGNRWYRVFYMHRYRQPCGQNSGEGSKHVEDIKKMKY
jgi:hypothetical protein